MVKMSWVRFSSILSAILGSLCLLDAFVLLITVLPKKPVAAHFMPPWKDHWWSDLIVTFSLVFITGALLIWAAWWLWRRKEKETSNSGSASFLKRFDS